jgi:hypothetical protein
MDVPKSKGKGIDEGRGEERETLKEARIEVVCL